MPAPMATALRIVLRLLVALVRAFVAANYWFRPAAMERSFPERFAKLPPVAQQALLRKHGRTSL